jgi:hypothetical protein
MIPEKAAGSRRAVASITRRLVAVIAVSAVLATTTGARAQETPEPQSPQEAEKARERANCLEELQPLEKAIESDGKYAVGWRDAWLVTGTGLVTLNLTGAFVNHGYRRTEAIVGAVQSLLLMIQKPVAVTNERALDGLRGAESLDPCLAVINARNILDAAEDDHKEHTNLPAQILAIAIPVVMGAILAGTTGHWDFIGNGNEGLNTVVGVALGEIALWTWPRPSMHTSWGPSPSVKMGASSLMVTF